MTKVNYISVAKKSAAIQIKELKKINKVFNKNFVKAVDIIHKAKGKVVCSGVGKSGLIARKVSACLSSVGISSFFLDPNPICFLTSMLNINFKSARNNKKSHSPGGFTRSS